MTAFQLVALDLDGTLVEGSSLITPRNRAAVQALLHRGLHTVIITGRMYVSAAGIAANLGLRSGTPIIAYNGALVRGWPAGETWLHRPLPLPAARSVAAWAEGKGYYIQAYLDDCLYVSVVGPEAEAYSRHARVAFTVVGPLSRWLREPPTKLLLIAPPGQVKRVGDELATAFLGQARVVGSLGDYIEVTDPSISKSIALAEVCRRLGISQTAVLAMGDSWNDVDMLRWAGCSVAMANAPAGVREAATAVAASVAEGLELFGLIG